METGTIILSAVVGVIAGAASAYVTTRLKIREERVKWAREFATQYAETQVSDFRKAQAVATQFAVGLLIYQDMETKERHKVFVPANCRIIAGKEMTAEILLKCEEVSAKQCAFVASQKTVYVEDLGARWPISVDGKVVRGRVELKDGSIITVGNTPIEFVKLGVE
ncbi:MAG: FHA domain-containing protein [Tepidisphaeraceae bacterium]